MKNFDIMLYIPSLVGLAFIVLGQLMKKFPPKKINHLIGYRTPTSMGNQNNWDFSQAYSAQQFIIIGRVLIGINAIAFFFAKQWLTLPIFHSAIIIIAVFFAIFKTELAIRNLNHSKAQ